MISICRLLAERQMYDEAKEKKEQMEEFRVEVSIAFYHMFPSPVLEKRIQF